MRKKGGQKRRRGGGDVARRLQNQARELLPRVTFTNRLISNSILSLSNSNMSYGRLCSFHLRLTILVFQLWVHRNADEGVRLLSLWWQLSNIPGSSRKLQKTLETRGWGEKREAAAAEKHSDVKSFNSLWEFTALVFLRQIKWLVFLSRIVVLGIAKFPIIVCSEVLDFISP